MPNLYYACTLEFHISRDEFPSELYVEIYDDDDNWIDVTLATGEAESGYIVLPPNREVYLRVKRNSGESPVPYVINVRRWEVADVTEPDDDYWEGAVVLDPGTAYTGSHLCGAYGQEYDILDWFEFEVSESTVLRAEVSNGGFAPDLFGVNLSLLRGEGGGRRRGAGGGKLRAAWPRSPHLFFPCPVDWGGWGGAHV